VRRPETETVWLGLLCLGRLGAALPFMMYAGALTSVAAAWGMTARAAGSIQTAFNVSYGVSLVVTSRLADQVGAKRVMLWSAWLTALAAAGFALFARSCLSGLLLFAAVGAAQGGIYASSILLVAQGVASHRRGTALGWLLAASSLGYFVSIALAAAVTARFGYRAAFLVCGTGPALGAMALVPCLRPNLVARCAARPRNGLGVLGGRSSLLVTIGYTAHCWELLGMWAWMPAFLSAALRHAGETAAVLDPLSIAAAIHGAGGLASLSTGWASDRFGRKRVLVAWGFLGAACSFTIGWSMHQTKPVVLCLAALYGFAALGDSPVLSTAMTESVEAGRLGTALAVRSMLGFGAGGLAPLAFGSILGGAQGAGLHAPWGRSFAALGCGGLLAAVCALLLPGDSK
jgi:MFS family permease